MSELATLEAFLRSRPPKSQDICPADDWDGAVARALRSVRRNPAVSSFCAACLSRRQDFDYEYALFEAGVNDDAVFAIAVCLTQTPCTSVRYNDVRCRRRP